MLRICEASKLHYLYAENDLVKALADLKGIWKLWEERKARQRVMEDGVERQGILDACVKVFET